MPYSSELTKTNTLTDDPKSENHYREAIKAFVAYIHPHYHAIINHPKFRTSVGDSIIGIVVVLTIIFGYPYTTGEKDKDYLYSFQFNAVDARNSTIHYAANIEMKAKAFAAHMPIDINATILAYVPLNDKQGTALRPIDHVNATHVLSSVYVIFPRSHELPIYTGGLVGETSGGYLKASNYSYVDHTFQGSTTIQYEMQGSYILGIQSYPYDIIENQTGLASSTLINIASEEAVTQIAANRLFATMTLVVIVFAIIAVRPAIQDALKDYDNKSSNN